MAFWHGMERSSTTVPRLKSHLSTRRARETFFTRASPTRRFRVGTSDGLLHSAVQRRDRHALPPGAPGGKAPFIKKKNLVPKAPPVPRAIFTNNPRSPDATPAFPQRPPTPN